MKGVRVLLTISCLISLFGCDGRILLWIPNTDFENPRNWRTGFLPCNNEHVQFPPTTASVFVQRNYTMLEIVLPNDGEVVLGENVIVTFLSAPDTNVTCAEQDAFYNGSEPASWFDVRNWCDAGDNNVCKRHQPRRLHTEGIPCVYDDVVFPFDSRFVVDIDTGADIRVNTVRIGQQQLTTSELRDRINSDTAHQFVRSSTGSDTMITVTDNSRCTDVSGCTCSNEQLEEKVCAIETSRCNVPFCDDPIQPQQHCCLLCGAVLKLQYDSGFRLDAIEKMISDIYQSLTSNESSDEDGNVNIVWWIVSKVRSDSETVIQVVIADDGDGASAKVVAYDVKKLLQNDMKYSRRLGVTSMMMDVSGSARHAAHTGGQVNKASSPGVIVAIVIVVIIAIAIIGAVMCYMLRRQGKRMPMIPIPQFMHLRQRGDRRSESFGDMELGRRGVVFDNRIIFDVSATTFDNLTFGNQPQHLEQLEVQPGMVDEAGFDNPVYGTGDLQQSFGIPSAEANVVQAGPRVCEQPMSTLTQSKLDSLPLVSRMANMLRGMRFNVASQKLEETPSDVTRTENDVNDNEKSYDNPPFPAETAYDVLSTADVDNTKKRDSRKMKKSGRKEPDGKEKHHKMEQYSTDSDEDLTGKRARKLATQMSEKGFGNPCYELGPTDSQPVTMASTTTSEATTSVAATESYRTGFANPMFEETERTQITLQEGKADENHA